MKTNFIRWLCAAMVLLMVIPFAVSCGNNENPPVETTAGSNGTTKEPTDDAPTTDRNGFILDSLPETFDTEMETTKIMYWKDAENTEYEVAELSGSDIIGNALFSRNLSVENRMNITLEYFPVNGNYNNVSNFTTNLSIAVNTGIKYDLVSAYSMVQAVCARDGLLSDLTNTYLDTTKPWWPEGIIEGLKIGDSLYFATGDASINTLYMMYCCYFNKSLLEAHYPDLDIYSVVENDEWTYNKFLELINGVYSDAGEPGKDAAADTFGVVGNTLYSNAMIEAFGFSEIENKDGKLTVTSQWNSEEVENVIVSLQNMFASEYAINADTSDVRDSFNTGRSMFAVLYADQAAKRFSKNQSLSYGVVPLPKLDSQQESYITPIANPASFYGIAVNSEDISFASAVLECWASEGYRQVSPTLFEKCFKLKYSINDQNARMYDYIRNGMKFNLARLFGLASNREIVSFTLAPTLDDVAVSWLTLTSSRENGMVTAVRLLNSYFENLE